MWWQICTKITFHKYNLWEKSQAAQAYITRERVIINYQWNNDLWAQAVCGRWEFNYVIRLCVGTDLPLVHSYTFWELISPFWSDLHCISVPLCDIGYVLLRLFQNTNVGKSNFYNNYVIELTWPPCWENVGPKKLQRNRWDNIFPIQTE